MRRLRRTGPQSWWNPRIWPPMTNRPLGVCLNEANIPLEGEVPTVSLPSVEEVGMGAPSRVVIAITPLPKPTDAEPNKKRLLDRVLVSTYVPPPERVHPLTDMVTQDIEDVLKIARC